MNGGNNYVMGGDAAGTDIDTVIYSTLRHEYTITSDGRRMELTSAGRDGRATHDILDYVERVVFADGVLDTNIFSNAAWVARIYETTLDRSHDQGGLKAWVGGLEGGMTIEQIADGFMQSAEFQGKYGSLDDAAFVRQL
jgi:hypothetical protein